MKMKPNFNVRGIENLKDMLEQSTKLFGEKEAFLVKVKDDEYKGIKYTEFKNDVDAFGTALINLGLKDKFIAVIGENRYEWCVTYMASVNGTGIVVPLDKELPKTEIANLLARSNASAIVFSGKFDKEMKEISASTSSVKFFINMDLENDEEGFLSYRQLINKGKELLLSNDRSFIDAKIDNESMNILLFTSGTTDLAKGVMLSHKNICSNLVAVCSMIYIDSNDSVLSILPLHHTYENTCGFLLMLYNGCTISFNEGLKHIGKNLKETRPTVLLLVPLILESMYKKIWDTAAKKKGMKTKLKIAIFISNILRKVFKIDIRKKLFKTIHDNVGGRIRLIMSGAAAVNPEVLKGFRSIGITILQGFGLTECSPIVTVNQLDDFRDSSIGLPIAGVEVKIVDADKDGIGEIVTKGDNVMLGYFENEDATNLVIKDKWLYTGDLGHMDSHGFFYITGRKKNVIIAKNGKNIFPEEVEASLNKSPYIKESLIWGKHDEVSDETVVNAQIVPDFDVINERIKGSKLSEAELYKLIKTEVKNINRTLPLYKRVRKFEIRQEEFEKTTTRKIKRYAEKAS